MIHIILWYTRHRIPSPSFFWRLEKHGDFPPLSTRLKLLRRNTWAPLRSVDRWRTVIIVKVDHTVDGWTPAPVDRLFISLFTGIFTSQVVQDFFHQQYPPWCTPAPDIRVSKGLGERERLLIPEMGGELCCYALGCGWEQVNVELSKVAGLSHRCRVQDFDSKLADTEAIESEILK